MLFPDELDTVMSSAHQLGRPVAVHAHSTAAINAALAAGARTIEHGTYFDDESVRLFEKSGAYLVPTSLVAEFGLKMMENFKRDMSAADWERVKITTELMYKTSGRAWRAGIKIAAGTDLGTSLTVDNARELGIYVDNGISATEAIRTATVNAADVIGMAGQLGQIRPGYLADIIATRTSPLCRHLQPAACLVGDEGRQDLQGSGSHGRRLIRGIQHDPADRRQSGRHAAQYLRMVRHRPAHAGVHALVSRPADPQPDGRADSP